MQAIYDACFTAHHLDAIWFPTTPVAAIPIDLEQGSSTVAIEGHGELPSFTTIIRNCDPGSIIGLPGISVPAGLTHAGLPVGLGLDGPIGSDTRLLAIGMAIEPLLGPVPGPKY
ncbi:hypothetical protein DBB29_15990 [Pandoraea cepalis]|uniref:Amidase domain-containing protein n=2 Tax=Pandoraea cepalis TaxID=2508294 RepID=A0AAW7MMV2_9BURK|nr:hypothetical protein [Pandoraea cepalis]MDN4579615.1 hypothetical protein [Pandoraea cepalis]